MGHCRGRAGEGFSTAEADREVGDLERVEEGERLLLAALQIEREGGAGAAAMATVDVGLTRAFIERAEEADLLDLGMAFEEVADLHRILLRAAHPELERLE